MKPSRMSVEEARRRADQQFDKGSKRKEPDLVAEKKRIQMLNAEKTARLRALRLAKEAQESEAAALVAAEQAARPERTRRKTPPPSVAKDSPEVV